MTLYNLDLNRMNTQAIQNQFVTLLQKRNLSVLNCTLLPGQASDRRYFRLYTSDNQTYIGTYSENISENETFFYFAQHFENQSLVPKVFEISEDRKIYIQQDFGDVSLLHILRDGFTDKAYTLFQTSLKKLALMQIKGHQDLDYTKCFSTQKFDYQTIIADLYYFKFCFVDALKIQYNKQKLANDFDRFIAYLMQFDNQYFMFRDFQSRNIQIFENEPYFIDFQGGMQGSMAYDVASLLWQARANLPLEWKENLLKDYVNYANEYLDEPIDFQEFKKEYDAYLLVRMIQVLGAYGFRGLFERKPAFIESIPQALENIQWFLENIQLSVEIPELINILQQLTQPKIQQQFMTIKAIKDSKLEVQIQSFSFRKGIPEDTSGNGGGFVFDCRGILNPGRIEEYKVLTGRDKAVQEYLETKTEMPKFLQNVFNIVDISVENYLSRDFEHLMVSFGCTGGQHRSVYSADALAQHLQSKYGVKTTVTHVEQEAKNWINEPY